MPHVTAPEVEVLTDAEAAEVQERFERAQREQAPVQHTERNVLEQHMNKSHAQYQEELLAHIHGVNRHNELTSALVGMAAGGLAAAIVNGIAEELRKPEPKKRKLRKAIRQRRIR